MKPIIIANWKMNPGSLKEAKKLFSSVCQKVKNSKAEVVFSPPFYAHLDTRQSRGTKSAPENYRRIGRNG